MEDRQKLGINSGDTVRVWQKIQEKGKIRKQAFEGLVLARKHGNEPGATFTVRRVTSGIGIEKIFPLYSPSIDKIEIIKRSKVRRAKLYYIREKAAKEIKRQMRRMTLLHLATVSDIEEKEKALRQAQDETEKAAKEAEEKVAEEETQNEDAKTENEPSSDEEAGDTGEQVEDDKKDEVSDKAEVQEEKKEDLKKEEEPTKDLQETKKE